MEVILLAKYDREGRAGYIRGKLLESGLNPEKLLQRCFFAPHPETGNLELAVSGGADSVAMLVLGALVGPGITIWHLDHGLRSTSSAEAEWVHSLAEAFGASYKCYSLEVEPGPNLEERARDKRRELFIEGVSTGHTSDDLAETMIINLIRGSGLRGLGSISYGSEHPILNLRRWETELICRALGLDFATDESNFDPRFIRNRVRGEVIPLLADVAKRDVVPIFARSALIFQQAAEFIATKAKELDPTDAKAIAAADEVVAIEALRMWLIDDKGHSISRQLALQVLRVAKGERVAVDLPGAIRVRRSRGRLSKFEIQSSKLSSQ